MSRKVLLLAVVLLLSSVDGKQQVSVVAVDVMWNYLGLSPLGKAEGKRQLESACSRGFNKIRMAMMPFWPDQMKSHYLQNKSWYWSQVDEMVADAKQHNCQIIPSLFWNWFSLADATYTPLGDGMRNLSSPLALASIEYIEEIASRYSNDSNVIAYWELGNELNLIADLNLTQQQPQVHPSLGTPTKRTQRDNFSTDDMIAWETFLVNTIMEYDTVRPFRGVSTGHSVPRDDAEHLRRSYHDPRRDWTKDTVAEFKKNLKDTCKCCTHCSVHVYGGPGMIRWSNTNASYPVVMHPAAEVAYEGGKLLYLGEFGDPLPGPRPFSHTMLDLIPTLPHASTTLPLATIWVWEFYQDSKTQPANFSLIPGRDDAMIHRMEAFNNQSSW